MAHIIDYSHRPMADKHEAWQALIDHYPDMPAMTNRLDICFDSTHQELIDTINYEQRILEWFKTPESGVVYIYDDHYCDTLCFSSFEKAFDDMKSTFSHDKVTKIDFDRVIMNNTSKYDNRISARYDYDGNLFDIRVYASEEERRKWIPDLDRIGRWNSVDLHIDIPVPFKRGDLLIDRGDWGDGDESRVFVLDSYNTFEELEQLAKRSPNFPLGRSDMIGWGFFVDDVGAQYGDHTGEYDSYEYYKGKLKGKNRLLHYVSLYINDKIQLPALLNMQCRIVVEHLMENNFVIDGHGSFISEQFLAENRLTSDEKKAIEETNGLMPWVAGKLSIHQVEFLARELGKTSETIQIGLANGGGGYMGCCAGIVHDENNYEKTNDTRFNPARKEMARLILEAYGETEAGWIDNYAEDNSDSDEGDAPTPNYT